MPRSCLKGLGCGLDMRTFKSPTWLRLTPMLGTCCGSLTPPLLIVRH